MHGIVMIASTIIMVSAVFGNYIVPIMIGANDMAFPRLNALSYWTLFSAVPVLLTTVAPESITSCFSVVPQCWRMAWKMS